jgi:hypothetical protein
MIAMAKASSRVTDRLMNYLCHKARVESSEAEGLALKYRCETNWVGLDWTRFG